MIQNVANGVAQFTVGQLGLDITLGTYRHVGILDGAPSAEPIVFHLVNCILDFPFRYAAAQRVTSIFRNLANLVDVCVVTLFPIYRLPKLPSKTHSGL